MYYQKTIKQTLKELKTSVNGLSNTESKKRQYKYGKNELPDEESVSKLKLFLEQFKSFIIYILIAASLISFILKEYTDGIIIAVIIVLNAVLGFVQEYKAEKAVSSLKKMQKPSALVIRNGKENKIPAEELVPGDIIIVKDGSFVPADCRIVECFSLKSDESLLTGESVPVTKNSSALNSKKIISDRTNMMYSGTTVVLGHGKAVVTSTGADTEIGKIAEDIKTAEVKPTPLQKKLDRLGKHITWIILGICLFIFAAGLIRGLEISEIFLTSVALAVAAIPEGLPAVITITLALGTQKLVKQNALIRKLPAVEALGSTTIICSDKTGTLTKNEMTVTEIYANSRIIRVSGTGYDLKGNFTVKGKMVNPGEFYKIFEIGSLCNNAGIENSSNPTEKAILVAAKKADLIYNYKRTDEIPFDPGRKYMCTVNEVKGKKILYMKGAPEIVLDKCRYIINKNQIKILTEKEKSEILRVYSEMAGRALRVLGFAYSKSHKEKDLVFSGLMAMIDPPRKEVRKSISECLTAGIRVVMVTGDHEITAKAVGRLIGITGSSINGESLDKMNDTELIRKIGSINIFARVTPKHKVRILKALQKKGEIVAMTGDGINDAPALKNSDIGTAIGSGTDVAREASSMILLDDNFVTIVKAVKEGRGIYTNIKKFIKYLFSSNLGELLVIFTAILLGLPLPLIAVQILWINLVTDGLPALALSEDPVPKDIMKRKPRNPKSNIIEGRELSDLIIPGIIMCLGTLFLFKIYLNKELVYAQTAAFTCLMMFQMFNVFNYRESKIKNIFENKYLSGAVLISILLQILVVYGLNGWFKTVPLMLIDWVWITLVSSTVFIVMQVKKTFFINEPV